MCKTFGERTTQHQSRKGKPYDVKYCNGRILRNPTPLNQVANVNTPDGRTLSIQPWKRLYYPKLKRVSYNQT